VECACTWRTDEGYTTRRSLSSSRRGGNSWSCPWCRRGRTAQETSGGRSGLGVGPREFPIRIEEIVSGKPAPELGKHDSGSRGARRRIAQTDQRRLHIPPVQRRQARTIHPNSPTKMHAGGNFRMAVRIPTAIPTNMPSRCLSGASGITPFDSSRPWRHPIRFSLMAKTAVSNLTVRPVFAHASPTATPRSRSRPKPVLADNQCTRWNGKSRLPAGIHQQQRLAAYSGYPLNLERIELNAMPVHGKAAPGHVSFLTQLPGKRTPVHCRRFRLVPTGTGTLQRLCFRGQQSLKPLETSLDYVLSDAHGRA